MSTLIKASIEIGHPPIAVIFNDPSHKDWGVWDYKLIKAYFILQDWYRDGIPIWWDESERVTFDAKPRTSKSRAAIERAQDAASKKKKPASGLYFVAEPRVMDGGDMPTKAEWLEEQARLSGGVKRTPSRNGNDGQILQGRK